MKEKSSRRSPRRSSGKDAERVEAFHGTGLSIKEIAQMAGYPTGTIKARLARSRDRLVAEATKAELV